MTTKEFNYIVNKINKKWFFENGIRWFLAPMNIYLHESIYPIDGEYFIGIKGIRAVCDLEENIISLDKIEKIKIHYKNVQRLSNNKRYTKNIKDWEYTEPTIKSIRREKLNIIKRLRYE